MDSVTHSEFHRVEEADSPAAWLRLAAGVLIGTLGGAGLCSGVVALPAVQAGFGGARADAPLPYTLSLIGHACRGATMCRAPCRHRRVPPFCCGGRAAAPRHS